MIRRERTPVSPPSRHLFHRNLKQLIYALKEAVRYENPWESRSPLSTTWPHRLGIVRAGADFVVIDGLRGGPERLPGHSRPCGIPIELAISVVDQRLREEGQRNGPP